MLQTFVDVPPATTLMEFVRHSDYLQLEPLMNLCVAKVRRARSIGACSIDLSQLVLVVIWIYLLCCTIGCDSDQGSFHRRSRHDV